MLSSAMVLPSDSEQKVKLFLVYPEHKKFTKLQKFSFNLQDGKELTLFVIPLDLPVR